MCGRYAITLKSEPMAEIFATFNTLETVPRYNVAPTQPVPVIRNESGRRLAFLARWGLVPRWVKAPRDFPLMINARAETMAEKPAFRDAFRHGRCVLPASGYYEWQALPGRAKQPFYIAPVDGAPMALAGLWTVWSGPEGEEVETVAIVTVAASPALAPIHDRMPAILRGEAIARWLDVFGTSPAEARDLAAPLPDGILGVHPVSTRVNSVRFDDPGLIEPVLPEPPAPPGGQADLFGADYSPIPK